MTDNLLHTIIFRLHSLPPLNLIPTIFQLLSFLGKKPNHNNVTGFEKGGTWSRIYWDLAIILKQTMRGAQWSLNHACMDHGNFTGPYLHSILCAKCPFLNSRGQITKKHRNVLQRRGTTDATYHVNRFNLQCKPSCRFVRVLDKACNPNTLLGRTLPRDW
jgi:hypothetical protein